MSRASSPPRSGLFLAFEGVEGSGKSTQVGRLAESLRTGGHTVVTAREPGSTPLGERVRDTVLGDHHLHVPARSELFLMLAARAAFIDEIVRPALRAGHIVIADRFELSTLAYQGAGRGIPLGEVRECNRVATGGLSPDATLLLELSPEEGARRQAAAGKRQDRLEREGAAFHQRVASGYRELADRIPGVLRVDADGSVVEVSERVLQRLSGRFPETFAKTGVISSVEHSRSASEAGSHQTQAVSEDE